MKRGGYSIGLNRVAVAALTAGAMIFGLCRLPKVNGRTVTPPVGLGHRRPQTTGSYNSPAGFFHPGRQKQEEPLALAAGDFDEDGVPDLVSSYAGPGGMLALYRGNADLRFPNLAGPKGRQASERSPESPFLPLAQVGPLAFRPDLLAVGDFNADGHLDIMAAARGDSWLYLLPGDGRGGFGSIESVQLPGRITALGAGEFNQADGLVDLAVGVMGHDGPQALILESSRGAFKAKPEAYSLPAEARAFAFGEVNDDYWPDVAVAAGQNLVVIEGRNRRLSEGSEQTAVPSAAVSRYSLPYEVASVAVGNFTRPRNKDDKELALLSDDGGIHLLSARDLGPGAVATSASQPATWQEREFIGLAPPSSSGSFPQMVRARFSPHSTDDLLVFGTDPNQLYLIPGGEDSTAAGSRPDSTRRVVPLNAGGEVRAALPMFVNADGLADLVVLKSGQVAPSVVFAPAAASPFIVTNNNDSGPGSLRQAIIDANSSPGADTIQFSIGAGVKTINLASPLPAISDTVMIDGTTQPGFVLSPIIVLNGGSRVRNGLVMTAANSVVRGLVIQSFAENGILITGPNAAGNQIQGNYIGTTEFGDASRSNFDDGIEISGGAHDNLIGGTTTAARNLISGNFGDGVFIDGVGSDHNTVQGNLIGTDIFGTGPIPNGGDPAKQEVGFHGVEVARGSKANLIGGTLPGARNLIAGNLGDNILLISAGTSHNLVQGNYLGTNDSGTASLIPDNSPLVTSIVGVEIRGSTDNLVGGTSPQARNLISASALDGILINGPGAANNLVQGNYIGTSADGTQAVVNGFAGVELADGAHGNTIGGTAAGAGNVISGNALIGVGLFMAGTENNLIQGNLIGVSPVDGAALGNHDEGVVVALGATHNLIGGTEPGAGNTIANNGATGVLIVTGTNPIRQNSIYYNQGLGIGLVPEGQEEPQAEGINDPCDLDKGGNDLQNSPLLSSASSTSRGLNIKGTLNSTPGVTFTLEFFFGLSCSGQVYIGSAQVTTGSNCQASFDVTLPVSVPRGAFITATATDAAGNTSEFSSCVRETTQRDIFPRQVASVTGERSPQIGRSQIGWRERNLPFEGTVLSVERTVLEAWERTHLACWLSATGLLVSIGSFGEA